MTNNQTIAEITTLILDLSATLSSSDEINLTVGATLELDMTGEDPDPTVAEWSYQTGDNTYFGPAYHHANWGVGWVSGNETPDTATVLAKDILGEILN
jgi:hypothetical protein